jgi:hypothetical protein
MMELGNEFGEKIGEKVCGPGGEGSKMAEEHKSSQAVGIAFFVI